MISRERIRIVFDQTKLRTGSEDRALRAVARAAIAIELGWGSKPKKPLSDEEILRVRQEVAAAFAMYVDGPQSLWQHRPARWTAARILLLAGMSLPQTALALGFDNHTSVLYARRKVDADPEMSGNARRLFARLFPSSAQEELFRARPVRPAPAPEVAA